MDMNALRISVSLVDWLLSRVYEMAAWRATDLCCDSAGELTLHLGGDLEVARAFSLDTLRRSS